MAVGGISDWRLAFSCIFILISIESSAQYFQQDINYTIRVSLDDKKHILNAHETIIYKNNSATAIDKIYFHLWPAAYKDETTALAEQYYNSGDNRILVAKPSSRGDIDSLDFMVDDRKVDWHTLKDMQDVCEIKLNTPLIPGQTITISTPFRVKIPASNMSRLGHYMQAYYITQWYPKPAVFDSTGWNYFSYLDKGEFYSEFGTFDVFITLPENYLLAATGLMQDAKEESAWLEKQDSLTRATTEFPSTDSFPLSSPNTKTIHFHQDKIHDFALFADKRWHAKKDTLKLQSGKTISVWSFFNNNQSAYWLKANDIIKQGVTFYSDLVGEYPYDAVTAVDVGYADGAGMEYPMITSIGTAGSLRSFEIILVHEIGHNWFYGILGSNERCHGWMDEGVNKFYETRYIYTKYETDSTKVKPCLTFNFWKRRITPNINHRDRQVFSYLASARLNADQSPDLCSGYNLRKYQSAIYHKPSLSLDYLKTYLGEKVFDDCMKRYFDQWKFRHPSPLDMQHVFESVSGKDLRWIFDDLMQSTKKIDYRLVKTERRAKDSLFVRVKNKGDIAAPFSLSSFKDNKIVKTVWTEGFNGEKTISITDSDADFIHLDAEGKMPELYSGNNTLKTHGLFRKTEPLQFKFLSALEDPTVTHVFYAPVIGWNLYNGLMAGVIFHNISFLEKKFEYRLMPLYATNSKNLAGGGDISYHIYPNSDIYRITFRSGISRYAFSDDAYTFIDESKYESTLHYTKLDSRIIFSIRQKHEDQKINNELTLRHIYLLRELPYFHLYKKSSLHLNYYQAEYKHENQNPLEKGVRRINVTGNEDYIYLSGELKQFFNYNSANKGFDVRVYLGFMNIYGTLPGGMEHRMNLTGKNGGEDYLFDEVFLGRSEEQNSFLSHQFVNEYAGFKSPTVFYRYAEKWMTGVNVSTTLPGLIPFRIFANVGSFNDHTIADITGNISWEIGVDLPVIKDIFIIYLPFAYSEDIKYALDRQDLRGFELVRFELHLKKLNPLDYIKNLYK